MTFNTQCGDAFTAYQGIGTANEGEFLTASCKMTAGRHLSGTGCEATRCSMELPPGVEAQSSPRP